MLVACRVRRRASLMYLYREDLERSVLVAMHVGAERTDDDYETSRDRGRR
jgi:hypothetical protein